MNSFGARSTIEVLGSSFEVFRLEALEKAGFTGVSRLPYSLRILLENLLRHEDGTSVRGEDIAALAGWNLSVAGTREIAFMPARVLMQDFTGVPAIVDLAAMRDAMAELGGDAAQINPLLPAELIIDHSMQVDRFAAPDALQVNRSLDYSRNAERYALLRWGQQAFSNFQVVPPYTGICHQVNLEYLARVVMTSQVETGSPAAYPDTLVGTDSHTTMINGLGVLGWGVGGIEAEAAMLGQKISMLIPPVLGIRLIGALGEGTTATDLVLSVTEMLRRKGVVGKFVEFYGPGLASVPLADRATIGNMAPEYGATCAIFPVDQETLSYLKFTGRSAEHVQLVERYMKEQGLFHGPESVEPDFTESVVLDLSAVEPSIAGPRRPQDRVALSRAGTSFEDALKEMLPAGAEAKAEPLPGDLLRELTHGSVVIASITSCTNTSNPNVMLGAALLARNAVQRGLRVKPWVKTSLAPGSQVVTKYLEKAGLMPDLEELGFHLVGYGCGTCIGNSGPLAEAISKAISERKLVVCSVLSGNRNFEGRIHAEVRANYLMSPPLVVAYAIAGTLNWNPHAEPLGHDSNGAPVYLKDIWPTSQEISSAVHESVQAEMFTRSYAEVFAGDELWKALPVPAGAVFKWDDASTYIRRPVFFEGLAREALSAPGDIRQARALVLLGDSVTTDHISPAGSIGAQTPAGQYLIAHGVARQDFNSYGARRGNHEVMVRGTFANVRLKNRLAPGTEGGVTKHLPSGGVISIFEASERYRDENTPLVVLAGKDYGSGSSRDWAAKGVALLGVRAVIAESFERIHRSNLVGMGVLPLELPAGKTLGGLGINGDELFDVVGIGDALGSAASREVELRAYGEGGQTLSVKLRVRIDTPQEAEYYRHGGILPYVLRQIAAGRSPQADPGGPCCGPVSGEGRHAPGAVEEGSEESFPASDPPAY